MVFLRAEVSNFDKNCNILQYIVYEISLELKFTQNQYPILRLSMRITYIYIQLHTFVYSTDDDVFIEKLFAEIF